MSGGHITQQALAGLILTGILALSGCSDGGETERGGADRASVAETSSSETPSSIPDSSISALDDPSPEIVDVKSVESLPDAEPPDESMASAEEPPRAIDTPAPTPPAEEPPPATDAVTDAAVAEAPAEGKLVAVVDTKPGLTRVGATKCKVCHKSQYASWVESKHAERTPPLDCESCHGSGSEYKKKSIMQDPEIARAAGLVIPEKSFCVGCHQDDWQDDMLERVHAHQEDGAS